jgi:hypothetical protein
MVLFLEALRQFAHRSRSALRALPCIDQRAPCRRQACLERAGIDTR